MVKRPHFPAFFPALYPLFFPAFYPVFYPAHFLAFFPTFYPAHFLAFFPLFCPPNRTAGPPVAYNFVTVTTRFCGSFNDFHLCCHKNQRT